MKIFLVTMVSRRSKQFLGNLSSFARNSSPYLLEVSLSLEGNFGAFHDECDLERDPVKRAMSMAFLSPVWKSLWVKRFTILSDQERYFSYGDLLISVRDHNHNINNDQLISIRSKLQFDITCNIPSKDSILFPSHIDSLQNPTSRSRSAFSRFCDHLPGPTPSHMTTWTDRFS
jgi:hypothetical protein